jgi:hypothetical protein
MLSPQNYLSFMSLNAFLKILNDATALTRMAAFSQVSISTSSLSIIFFL